MAESQIVPPDAMAQAVHYARGDAGGIDRSTVRYLIDELRLRRRQLVEAQGLTGSDLLALSDMLVPSTRPGNTEAVCPACASDLGLCNGHQASHVINVDEMGQPTGDAADVDAVVTGDGSGHVLPDIGDGTEARIDRADGTTEADQ